MTQQALSGASARFMGGIFRAYTVAVREVRHGWPPLGGSYHSQAALLVVPRALWPDKPHVASEQLYYLLGVTEEDYGTAFAINLYGCLVFDFGLLGCLIGAAVVGVLLQAGDRAIPSWSESSPRVAAGAALAVLRDDVGLPGRAVVGGRHPGSDCQRDRADGRIRARSGLQSHRSRGACGRELDAATANSMRMSS